MIVDDKKGVEEVVTPTTTEETQVVEQVQDDNAQQVVEPTEQVEEVPEYNRSMEVLRKSGVFDKLKEAEETKVTLNKVLEKLDSLQTNSQNQPQKYTEQQLETFIEETDNDYNKQWAKDELKRMGKEEQSSLVRSELNKFQKEQQDNMIKQNTMSQVLARNPNLIVKDQFGSFIGWNNQDPMMVHINKYMSDPTIGNRPDGMALAEKLAFADLQRMKVPVTTGKIAEQKATIKDLQKNTLVEGGINNQQGSVSSPYSDAINKLENSGSVHDAAIAFKQRLQSRGVIKGK